MTIQARLIAATLALLVFYATNRKPVVLVDVVPVRTVVVVVQVHDVREVAIVLFQDSPIFEVTHDVLEVAIVLCRTPEVRVVALAVVIPIAVPAAGRQRRERVIISAAYAVVATVPATCRFEFCPRCCTGNTNCGKQRPPFRLRRQVPTCWANTTHRVRRRACLIVAAALAICVPCARTVHRGSPRIKATVLGAVGWSVAVTVAIRRFVVKVLGHPRLRTDCDCLVGPAIARIC